MTYVLKTYWPLPLSKTFLETEDEVVSKLDSILDYTQNFYSERGVNIDLEYRIDMKEGYRVFKINRKLLNELYATRGKKTKTRASEFIDRESGIMVTKEMYRTDSDGNVHPTMESFKKWEQDEKSKNSNEREKISFAVQEIPAVA